METGLPIPPPLLRDGRIYFVCGTRRDMLCYVGRNRWNPDRCVLLEKGDELLGNQGVRVVFTSGWSNHPDLRQILSIINLVKAEVFMETENPWLRSKLPTPG